MTLANFSSLGLACLEEQTILQGALYLQGEPASKLRVGHVSSSTQFSRRALEGTELLTLLYIITILYYIYYIILYLFLS
jgi:hypothetical protein